MFDIIRWFIMSGMETMKKGLTAKFRNAVSTTTLAACLVGVAMPVAMSSPAMAADTDNKKTTQAEKTPRKRTDNAVLMMFNKNELTGAQLAEKFPFAGFALDIATTDDNIKKEIPDYTETSYSYDTFTDEKNNLDFLVIRGFSSSVCGSLGCMTYIYASEKGKEDYRPVAESLYFSEEMHFLPQQAQPSFILCTNDNAEVKWVLDGKKPDGVFEFQGIYAATCRPSTPVQPMATPDMSPD